MENLKLAVQSGLSNYATFSGRAARPAYWWWALSVFVAMLAFGLLDALLFGGGAQVLTSVVGLALFLPNLAVGVRRLHDTGRSGWWMLLGLIPVLGFLVLVYVFAQPSTPGDNAYGSRPTWPPA